MVTITLEVSKYLMIILFAVYTLLSFRVLSSKKTDMDRKYASIIQRYLIFFIQVLGFLDIFVYTGDFNTVFFFIGEEGLFVFVLVNFWIFYEKAPRIVVNHLCMLLTIGFIMLQRLDFSLAVRQLIFAAAGIIITMFIPAFIRRVRILDRLKVFYAVSGILLFFAVFALGLTSYGAKLAITVGPVSIQPSEIVKIIFVFYVASSLSKDTGRRNVFITSVVALVHVLILVVSKDLGAGLIFFVVYQFKFFFVTFGNIYRSQCFPRPTPLGIIF